MRTVKQTAVTTALMAVVGIGMLAPFSAQASEAGRRNTTLGLGALTAGLAATRHWIPAAVAGVGTYYAYHNWQAQIDHRHRDLARLAYRHAYHTGYYTGRSSAVRSAYYSAPHHYTTTSYHRTSYHRYSHHRSSRHRG